MPDTRYEDKLYTLGYRHIAGIDEVGRGALAGPVIACAVILERSPTTLLGIADDSKKMTAHDRKKVSAIVKQDAIDWQIGLSTPFEVDKLGVVHATRKAMIRAIRLLNLKPDCLLVDALDLPNVAIEQKAIIKGDTISVSIAAASIVAKVTRDRIMNRYHDKWQEYGFISNKGYGTPRHINSLQMFGPSPIHRQTFARVKKGYPKKQLHLSNGIGKAGETAADHYLRYNGYRVIQNNYLTKHGEVDIIAQEPTGRLAFLEVRSRSNQQFGTPQESLTKHKKQSLLLTAQSFLQDHWESSDSLQWGIDMVAIGISKTGKVINIELIKDVIDADTLEPHQVFT